MLKNFRTYNLAVEFYRHCQGIKLTGELRSQFERATLSIALNLAEGSAKPTYKDRARFYRIALGSLRETQALLSLIKNETLSQEADVLGAHLYRLCKGCEKPPLY